MRNKYYYLVAGLPELSPDDSKLAYTVASFKSEFHGALAAPDRRSLDLFYLKFDNANVLRLLKEREAGTDARGNYTAAELLEYIAALKEGDKLSPKLFPTYLSTFIAESFTVQDETEAPREDRLSALYYAYGMKHGNAFVASWFEFNLNINNILTAFTCRKFKWEVAPRIVGDTEVCEALRTSSARDFGLSGEVDVLDELMKIGELTDLVEREKKLDALRWRWMEEATFFDYFTIERLFVFLLKLEMLERWNTLDKETGNKVFRGIIESLKDDVRIPAEFR
ncbi:MAG: DUF2764 domain-containing protein [Mediterranea sp.]|jgi:hypothetical protein|nr:DUF2764 domain-containing protein [Mediterranea sp.]